MELLQCVSTSNNEPRSRGFSLGRSPKMSSGNNPMSSSEERNFQDFSDSSKSSSPVQHREPIQEIGGRRVSLPNGHYSAMPMPNRSKGRTEFHHYGSSLSLTNGSTSELTSRTLRPPSPSTLRKSSTISNASNASTRTSPRPSLPSTKFDLESPKLADYLERPRLVSTLSYKDSNKTASKSAVEASHHHAKRMQNHTSPYRNLRLGNFMEGPEEEEELIPERLRQYYLETYLNVCDTCESLTHCNPVSPIHRGM